MQLSALRWVIAATTAALVSAQDAPLVTCTEAQAASSVLLDRLACSRVQGAGLDTADACEAIFTTATSSLAEEDRLRACTYTPPPRELVSLRDVQGSGDDSPYEGQTVRVIATVTGVGSGAFFIQDESMYGVYVYERSMTPAVGDQVELVGQISEYHGLTELSRIDAALSSVLSSGSAVPSR